jgi:uncharacterized protein YuzE
MKISHKYDKKADVMYFFIGKPKPSISENLGGVLIRKTLKGKLTGITILDFGKRETLDTLTCLKDLPKELTRYIKDRKYFHKFIHLHD